MRQSSCIEHTGTSTRATNQAILKRDVSAGFMLGCRGVLLLLLMAALYLCACAAAKEDQAPVSQIPEKAPSPATTGLPSRLFPTFEVAGDSCHVFLHPNTKSPYFGPLVKSEKLKRLDLQGSWIRVWIPRLRVSGWVIDTQVLEADEPGAGPETVPADFLSTVTVIAKRANIREAPTTQSQIVMVAKRNQEFWLLNEKEGWYQIWLPDLKEKGWISGKIVARLRRQ
jgi:uncharacterized protein YgiM (DUF1202 family)